MSNSEYDKLFSQYQSAIQKARDLQERLDKNNEIWQDMKVHYEQIEKNIRELCEDILSNIPSEMSPGADTTWSKTGILEIINKSKAGFKSIIARNVKAMNTTRLVAERRRIKIDELQEKINMILENPVAGKTKEDVENEYKYKKNNKDLPDETKARKGAITTDDDVQDAEEDVIENNTKTIVRINNSNATVKNSKKRVENITKKKADVAKKEINLEEYNKTLNDREWGVIHIIGKEGISRTKAIIAERKKKDPSFDSAAMSLAKKNLILVKAIEVYKLRLSGSPEICMLTGHGKNLFLAKYENEPCMSEADKVIRDHNNLDHGYEILYLAAEIKKAGFFEEVKFAGREGIKTPKGQSFIPDIICVNKVGRQIFLEYEHMNHNENGFNSKIRKTLDVSDTFNLVVKDAKEYDIAKKAIAAFLRKLEDPDGTLAGKRIRLASKTSIADKNFVNDSEWNFVYTIGKGTEPVQNK